MNTAIKDKQLEILIDLQEIDKEVQKFNQLKEKIPAEIEKERQIFEKINSEINELKEKNDQSKKNRRSKEMETQSAKDLLVGSKEKLPHVKTNKEYTAILQEIENTNNKINLLEEEEINLMESIEEGQKDYELKLKEKEAEDQKFLTIKKKTEEELENLNQRLDEELKQRNELTGGLEKKWAEHYKKAIAMRNGLAVVPIENDMCCGCYHSLRPQLSLEVRLNNSIIICPHCSRFLFSVKETGVD